MRSRPRRASDPAAAASALLQELARFACVGLGNTVLSYVVYATLVAAGAPYLAAGALAFTVGAINGYRLNRLWTFRASDSLGPRIRYLTVQAAGLAVTTGLLWLTVSAEGMHRLGGYLVTVPLVTLATFAANRSWTFRRRAAGPSERARTTALDVAPGVPHRRAEQPHV
jgi:putative flippase GtrA